MANNLFRKRAKYFFVFLLTLLSRACWSAPLNCDLSAYRTRSGLNAGVQGDALVVTWTSAENAELRISFTLKAGVPTIRDLAVHGGNGWAPLAENLTPEYRVTSGVRRMSEQQAGPLRALGVEITPDVIEKNKWYAFWDAPLEVPGTHPGEKTPHSLGLPRKPEEIRRATASFHTDSCSVKTEGDRIEIAFPGLQMGIFSGSLRFTVYGGTNLIRMEAIAKTDEQSVAYKYEAGLRGFSTELMPRIAWHDTGGHPQQYLFGGPKNEAAAPVKAQNRVLVAEGKNGSLATFPPPHTFFFTRELDTNLGYVWYRKDDDKRFAFGIRQPDR